MQLHPPAGVQRPLPLSPRERAVLRCIVDGRTNREISQELGLSLATVKRYITSLYGKLQVTSRTEAIQHVHGLITGYPQRSPD